MGSGRQPRTVLDTRRLRSTTIHEPSPPGTPSGSVVNVTQPRSESRPGIVPRQPASQCRTLADGRVGLGNR